MSFSLRHRTLCCAAVTAAALAGRIVLALDAQDGAAQSPLRFEAASVKRNTSRTDDSQRNTGAGGRMVFVNFSVRELIAAAYDIQPFQVIDGPAWVDTDRFDVIATAGRNAPPRELNLMLRSLLADRFTLVVRHEQRARPRYTLLKARADGSLGPALKRSSADCGPSGRGRPGAPLAVTQGPTAPCRAWMTPAGVDFAGQTIAELARVLAMILERPVIDMTGLSGGYDIALSFAPEPGRGPAPAGGADAIIASVFTALREQLGLTLEANRGAVDVIIVERVEPPSEN
jgi:uncharacterized protein (TIGR03435 family)